MNLFDSAASGIIAGVRHIMRTPVPASRAFSNRYIDLNRPYLVSKKTGKAFTGKPGTQVFKHFCSMNTMREPANIVLVARWYQRHCGKGYSFARAHESVMKMHRKAAQLPYDNIERWRK